MLKIIACSASNKLIVAGVYRLIRLSENWVGAFNELAIQNYIPDWRSLYREARAAGLEHNSIVANLTNSIEQVFGTEAEQQALAELEKEKPG
jgi:hypothetical protein